jgi:hypothetical protein
MKYRRPSGKKEDRLTLGVWPAVTLAQVRAKRDEAKKLLVQGNDPKSEHKEAKAKNSGAYTFETIAREWHASNKRWNEDHRSRVLRYLELCIFPSIGLSDIRLLKRAIFLPQLRKLMPAVSVTLPWAYNSVSRPSYTMLFRMITITQIPPVIWLERYRQPKHALPSFTPKPFP